MSWDKGFNFRGSSGYVTDGANETYVLDTDAYPTVRNGVTFGWTVNPSGGRDRYAGGDERLAGICFGNGNGTFQVDLPAVGAYAISLGMTDTGSNQTASKIIVRDNGTALITVGPHDWTNAINCGPTQNVYDATDTQFNGCAAWVSGQTPVTKVFGSTILQVTLEVATSNTTINHLFVSQIVTGTRFFLIPS